MPRKKNTYDPILGKMRKEDITNKDLEELHKIIDGKAPKGHTHTIQQVIGLHDELQNKSNVGHSHQMSDIEGLQQSFDALPKINYNTTINKLVVQLGNDKYAVAADKIIAPNTPTITAGATATYSKSVSITGITSGATTYYTKDGSDPKTSSSRQTYSSAFTLSQDTSAQVKTYTVRAISYKNGEWSEEATPQTFYIRRQVATPTFASATGNKYSESRTITFACATAGATIQYKIGNGSWTDGSSVTINATSKITLRATKSDWEQSNNSTETTYTLNANKCYIGQAAAIAAETDIKALANAYERDTMVGWIAPTINFGENSQYVFFAIPSTASKNLIIKSDGFAVTLQDPAGSVIGNYRVWRTAGKINSSFTFEFI